METDWERQREQERRTHLHLRDKRVVTIGGGTGPFAVLSSLKHYPCQITAIVTMVDSGGSSRRLSDEFGQLPFGDLRQALVALSRKGALWRDVFTFGFRQGSGQRTAASLRGLPWLLSSWRAGAKEALPWARMVSSSRSPRRLERWRA